MNTTEKSNNTTTTTKLKETEKSYSHRQQMRFKDRTDNTAEKFSLRDKEPKLVPEPVKNTCVGRGIAIEQLLEFTLPPNNILQPSLDFSNSSIEHHFKKLQAENMKTALDEKEKWQNMFSSKKS